MLTAIVYTLTAAGTLGAERERKACRSSSEISQYCDKMSRKYKRAAGVLIEVHDDQDQIVACHIV